MNTALTREAPPPLCHSLQPGPSEYKGNTTTAAWPDPQSPIDAAGWTGLIDTQTHAWPRLPAALNLLSIAGAASPSCSMVKCNTSSLCSTVLCCTALYCTIHSTGRPPTPAWIQRVRICGRMIQPTPTRTQFGSTSRNGISHRTVGQWTLESTHVFHCTSHCSQDMACIVSGSDIASDAYGTVRYGIISYHGPGRCGIRIPCSHPPPGSTVTTIPSSGLLLLCGSRVCCAVLCRARFTWSSLQTCLSPPAAGVLLLGRARHAR